ncbi:MAG: Holliday junction DNA helicase RuvA [Candidatus Omnitrophica bacterium]|nr:Holliday junction DNA helicase RuvA [Candidatus Omnitrophota bacterium]MCG2705710.1 helix-hairpin-helix domain-containing protein [Candidatus Omnitrophota bacterium]
MISQISGKLKQKKNNAVWIDVNGISYEVLLPGVVMKKVESAVDGNGCITLITYHYFQSDPSRSIPVLIGFLSEIEKEFFERFITVSGVGPKAACRAMELPFSAIADAIDKGDISILKSLPGIGEQRAREIIAKLQGKIGKYGLIQDKAVLGEISIEEDIKKEALDVLTQLQYAKSEAKTMIEDALSRNPKASSCEELLNEIYKQKQKRKKEDIKYAAR